MRTHTHTHTHTHSRVCPEKLTCSDKGSKGIVYQLLISFKNAVDSKESRVQYFNGIWYIHRIGFPIQNVCKSMHKEHLYCVSCLFRII